MVITTLNRCYTYYYQFAKLTVTLISVSRIKAHVVMLGLDEDIDRGFVTSNEKKANTLSFLTGSVAYLDGDSGEYRLVPPEQVSDFVRDLYKKNRYEDVERLTDSYHRRTSGADEKSLRELEAKSFRFPAHRFLRLLAEAYEQGRSVADLIRINISRMIEERLDGISSNSNFDEENFSKVMAVLEDWKSKKGRKPKSSYTLGWDVWLLPGFEEAIGKCYNHILFRIFDNELENPQLASLLAKYCRAEEFDIFTYSTVEVSYDSGLALTANFQIPAVFTPLREEEDLDSFLSDIANSGFTREDLEDVPPFKQMPRLLSFVSEIRGKETEVVQRDLMLETIDEGADSFFDNPASGHPLFVLTDPLQIKGDRLIWGNTALSDDLKGYILDHLVGEQVARIDVEERQEEVGEHVEKGESDKAREISHLINIRRNAEIVAEQMARIVLDAASSQVVSIVMPKAVTGLLELLEIDKEEL